MVAFKPDSTEELIDLFGRHVMGTWDELRPPQALLRAVAPNEEEVERRLQEMGFRTSAGRRWRVWGLELAKGGLCGEVVLRNRAELDHALGQCLALQKEFGPFEFERLDIVFADPPAGATSGERGTQIRTAIRPLHEDVEIEGHGAEGREVVDRLLARLERQARDRGIDVTWVSP